MSLEVVFPLTQKRPGFYAKLAFAQGPNTAGAGVLKLLLVGMKTSAGSIVANNDIAGPFTTQEEADVSTGARSQLGHQVEAAIGALRRSGLQIQFYLAAVAEPGGGTAATVTLALTGTWTTAGTWTIRVKGKRYSGGILATDTIDAVGAAMAAAINNDPRCPFTAAYNSSTDTVTLTCAQVGAQGRDWIIAFETDKLPAGFVGTLTGSASITSTNAQRVRAGAGGTGTGTEDVTTLLTKLQTQRWARISSAQNDSTNVALWKAMQADLEGPLKMLYDDVFVGHNGAQSAATTLASTNLNFVGDQVLAKRNSESHPCMLAAAKAAVAAAREGGAANANWVPDYDGFELGGIAPALDVNDNWTPAEQEALLNAGVTPLVTTPDGKVVIVRSITTYCLLNGATPDDRSIDRGDRVFPVNALYDSKTGYESEFRPAHSRVGPDPKDEENEPPAGVAYPRLWTGFQQSKNKEYYRLGLIEDPDLNPPVSEYNKAIRAIVCEQTWVVNRVQHALSFKGKQSAAA
jgi:phage tail sheath gpL-like